MKQPLLPSLLDGFAARAPRGASQRTTLTSQPCKDKSRTFQLLRFAIVVASVTHPSAALKVSRHGCELSTGNASTSAPGLSAPGVTDYAPIGCRDFQNSVADMSVRDNQLGMTVKSCFNLCKARASVRYFGLLEGHKCWCAPFFSSQPLGLDRCDAPCPGDPKVSCGGVGGATNVYVMFDCTPPTKEEKKKEKTTQLNRILKAYKSLSGQTCGQAAGSSVAVDGSKTMVADVEKCKLACWQAPGSMQCHGFTFDKDTKRCTFLSDAFDGNVTKKKGSSCFYKTY